MSKRIVLFIDSVHPILEEKLTQAGFLCQRHFKSTFEELQIILKSVIFAKVMSKSISIAKSISIKPISK